MSELKIGDLSVPAFSGLGSNANKRARACAKDLGPIPPGRYYIVDRPTGDSWARCGPGRTAVGLPYMRPIRKSMTLLGAMVSCAATFVFTPKGPAESAKDATIESICDFSRVSAMLRSVRPTLVAGVVDAYGVLTVS